MKKRLFSAFLVLALILTALAGCASNAADSSTSSGGDDESEQWLSTGCYEVYDEDDELAGYLKVTSSRITVFDEYGSEEDALRYDYSGKKELYTLSSGKLFGCKEFTVEKGRKKLTLITEDGEEYTLKEIDRSELPSGGKGTGASLSGGTDSGCIELPAGCYAGYNESDNSLKGYLKVMDRTMIFYYRDGDIEDEFRFSYDGDGSCVLEGSEDTYTVRITYERDSYYMSVKGESIRLEAISESEIPIYTGGTSSPAGAPSGAVPSKSTYFIGDNDSVSLYAWLPGALYSNLDVSYEDEGFTAEAEYYDYNTGTAMLFYAILGSGSTLQEAISEAQASYGGYYSSANDLLFRYLRDSFFGDLDSGYIAGEYLGVVRDYNFDEGYVTVNARNWRCCEVYADVNDAEAYLSLCFWMEGGDMAVVIIGGVAEDSDISDMYGTISDIVFSLKLST